MDACENGNNEHDASLLNIQLSPAKDEANPDSYYFESDHLALKGNPDYHNLLHCLTKLQAQKMRAIKDIEILYEKRAAALKTPIKFVESLQNQEDMGFPAKQKVADIPEIEWEKYASNINLRLYQENRAITLPKSSDPEQDTSNKDRQIKENKPSTFNRFWTMEEQKKLEELLIKYPPEAVESKRFQKIAEELGDRTTTQVASRIQKYFIKLAQAGLPVPGRIPNVQQYTRKGSRNRFTHLKHKFAPSTFFASIEPPVFMPEDDSLCSSSSMSNISSSHASTDQPIPDELHNSSEYRELMELKKLKSDIVKNKGIHYEFKCDNCGMEPIVGLRWHCSDCPPHISVDYCNECASNVAQTNIHDSSHRLKKINPLSTSGLDSDYQVLASNSSSYLDPNFMAQT